MENDDFKEETGFPRIVGDAKGMNKVKDQYLKTIAVTNH